MDGHLKLLVIVLAGLLVCGSITANPYTGLMRLFGTTDDDIPEMGLGPMYVTVMSPEGNVKHISQVTGEGNRSVVVTKYPPFPMFIDDKLFRITR